MRQIIIIFILVILNVFLYQKIITPVLLSVSFLDVGQGDSIYIRAPNGNDLLIDGGPNAEVLRKLGEVMPFSDKSLDVVIATHPDKDHIAGLVDVFERYNVDVFVDPGINSETKSYQALLRTIENTSTTKYTGKRGLSIDLGSGVFARILSPTEQTKGDTNSQSIVVQISYGNIDFLLVGDAPKRVEGNLVYVYGKSLRSEILKVGHHGSKTSSGDVFIETVKPEIAVISSGKNNSYGHPHKEVLDTLKKFGSIILRTDKRRTITVTSNGFSFSY